MYADKWENLLAVEESNVDSSVEEFPYLINFRRYPKNKRRESKCQRKSSGKKNRQKVQTGGVYRIIIAQQQNQSLLTLNSVSNFQLPV
jgi:hypothetical protein